MATQGLNGMRNTAMSFDPIDRDERIHADNWKDEPTEEDIERQRSIIESQADLEEMYRYEL